MSLIRSSALSCDWQATCVPGHDEAALLGCRESPCGQERASRVLKRAATSWEPSSSSFVPVATQLISSWSLGQRLRSSAHCAACPQFSVLSDVSSWSVFSVLSLHLQSRVRCWNMYFTASEKRALQSSSVCGLAVTDARN